MNKPILHIIIAHYKEPYEIVKPGLDMLENQKCFDFNNVAVTLIHDGTECFEELKGKRFPFSFNEVSISHRGIAGVRNYGIDISDSDWVTFCDCDDCFTSVYALTRIVPALNDDRFNMLWGSFYVHGVRKEENPLSINKDFNTVWVHNKYYRVSFLKSHNVRFNEDFEILEDGVFNMLFYLETPEGSIGELRSPEPLYSWCRREGSTTTTKDNLMKIIWYTFKRDEYVSCLFMERGRAAAPLMVGRTITDSYVILTQKRVESYVDDICAIEKEVKRFWVKHRIFIEQLTKPQWDYVLNASESECAISGVLNPDRPSFDDWLGDRLGVERKIKNG